MPQITKIIKRDGTVVRFDPKKITTAIFKAAQAVGGQDIEIAKKISRRTMEAIRREFSHKTPHVEEIQDIIEKVLIEQGHSKTAKAYILYREKRRELREAREAILGKNIKSNLSLNALKLLREKILQYNAAAKTLEMPDEMFMRVAANIAHAEYNYLKKSPKAKRICRSMTQVFYYLISSLDFLPNSPMLMNAGTDIQQLCSSYVLPVEDSLESIFDAIKYAALIHKTGAGTGFNFTKLRPRNDAIKKTHGASSGPVSFMQVFDSATNTIKQGGKRRGANMAILSVHHPDILEFIAAKDETHTLSNFNISVGLTNKFMRAVIKNQTYSLINPRTGEGIKDLKARDVFELIAFQAWKNGDPGIVFLDTINKYNPIPSQPIESTDSCACTPLLPYESCVLGSINLAHMVKDRQIDFKKLKYVVNKAVHFLDNAIDMNQYPLPHCEEISKKNRKIGLGVMGFADMLYQLGIPYNSMASVATATTVMKYIYDEAEEASFQLANLRGSFPNIRKSICSRQRNATLTTIAPTGTISLLADVSPSIEPNFSLCSVRRVVGKEFLFVNRYFEQVARERGFYSEQCIEKIKNRATIQHIEEIPHDVRRVFVLAHDIAPEWHLRVQSAFQRYTDNAVSKTVNFPNSGTVNDVERVYLRAFKLRCKGVTIYRDKSKKEQVMELSEW